MSNYIIYRMYLFSKNKKPIMKLFNKAGSPQASLFGKLVLSVNKKNLNRMTLSAHNKERHSPLEK
jgi:hypothetical protein